jgi:hypothetical protein
MKRAVRGAARLGWPGAQLNSAWSTRGLRAVYAGTEAGLTGILARGELADRIGAGREWPVCPIWRTAGWGAKLYFGDKTDGAPYPRRPHVDLA